FFLRDFSTASRPTVRRRRERPYPRALCHQYGLYLYVCQVPPPRRIGMPGFAQAGLRRIYRNLFAQLDLWHFFGDFVEKIMTLLAHPDSSPVNRPPVAALRLGLGGAEGTAGPGGLIAVPECSEAVARGGAVGGVCASSGEWPTPRTPRWFGPAANGNAPFLSAEADGWSVRRDCWSAAAAPLDCVRRQSAFRTCLESAWPRHGPDRGRPDNRAGGAGRGSVGGPVPAFGRARTACGADRRNAAAGVRPASIPAR